MCVFVIPGKPCRQNRQRAPVRAGPRFSFFLMAITHPPVQHPLTQLSLIGFDVGGAPGQETACLQPYMITQQHIINTPALHTALRQLAAHLGTNCNDAPCSTPSPCSD